MDHFKIWDFISGLIGLVSGGIAYLNADIIGITWDQTFAKLLSVCFAIMVAILTTAAGYATKKLLDKYWPVIVSKLKRKKK